jgi:hypothetical protein
VALPAVFLLQRGMASSKLFIGGEPPLSLYLSLFDFFLFYCIVASVSVCFVSFLFLFGNLSRRRREGLPIVAVHCQTLNLDLLISISRVHLFFNVWKHQAERARSCIEQKKMIFFP